MTHTNGNGPSDEELHAHLHSFLDNGDFGVDEAPDEGTFQERLARITGKAPADPQAHGTTTDALPEIKPDDWWVTTQPDDLWLGLDWDDLTLAERWIWHTPNASRETRFRLYKAVQYEREYEIYADRERRGIDRESNPQHGNGTNGA